MNTKETTNTIANIISVLRTNVTLSSCVKYGVNNVPATTNCAKSYLCIRRWPAVAGAVLNGSGAAAAAAS